MTGRVPLFGCEKFTTNLFVCGTTDDIVGGIPRTGCVNVFDDKSPAALDATM